MLSVLLLASFFAVLLSFLCSLTEAAFYAVPLSYAKSQAEAGSRSGKMLLSLKEDVSKPVAAILILNTGALTAGGAIVGAQAGEIWGELGLVIFSVLFSGAILLIGEITPKVLGVVYAKRLMLFLVYPLRLAILLLYPLVWSISLVSDRITAKDDAPSVSEEEVRTIAAIGTREGTLHHFEGSVISNVMSLDTTLVRDILTPRTSVFKMEQGTKLSGLREQIAGWKFSRVPIYDQEQPDHLGAYVTQRDIYRHLVSGEGNLTLQDISRELSVVPEVITLDRVLQHMFDQKEQIVSVVDEHGALAGILTLEDILEKLVGREIEDEYH